MKGMTFSVLNHFDPPNIEADYNLYIWWSGLIFGNLPWIPGYDFRIFVKKGALGINFFLISTGGSSILEFLSI